MRATQVKVPVLRAESRRSRLLQRCGRSCAPGACEPEQEPRLARFARGAGPSAVPRIVHDVLRSAGRPLESSTRRDMETRFGHDFKNVRVHADPIAGESALAVEAHAYTVGNHVSFAPGRYAPHTEEGQRILAHELAHVVQQGGNSAINAVGYIEPASSTAERDASDIALRVTSGAGAIPATFGNESAQHAGHGASGLRLQRLGANPACTPAEAASIHQAIFDARGWLNKALPKLRTSPPEPVVTRSLSRNFGPTYGVASNLPLIAGRVAVAANAISTIPFSCAGAADALCAANAGGYAVPGSRVATVCTNVTLVAGRDWRYQAGVVLHESFHASFSGFTAARDRYSGWHGASGSTAGYPGPGTDPLLDADTYTTLVMDLS